MATKPSPLIYNEGDRPRDPEEHVTYVVLGYLVYEEEDDELKVWEEFKDRRSLFDYLKVNYICLHLLKSKIYKVYHQENNKNCVALLKSDGKTVYDVIKQLQSIFINDDFSIDDEVDIDSYKYDL